MVHMSKELELIIKLRDELLGDMNNYIAAWEAFGEDSIHTAGRATGMRIAKNLTLKRFDKFFDEVDRVGT